MTATSVEGRTAGGGVRADEVRLVELARGGDDRAFGELASAYRAELRAHCYRMTGSVADAEDAVQEGLLRAWRGLAGFQGRGSVRSWLYAIVTNSAVDLTRHRSRRELPVAFGPSADPGADLDPPLTEQPWLDPYPDDWLTQEARLSPEARYEQRESVELAFLVALQHLPALQRAVLLLREVVGFSTAEIAGQLGTTAAAVNSALQRARAAIRRRLPAASQQSALRAQGDERTRALVQRYADAIERGDADTLISMLTADATWSMPPVPTWYRGHQAVRQFLASTPLTYQWRHLPARATPKSRPRTDTTIGFAEHRAADAYPTHRAMPADGHLAVGCCLLQAGTATCGAAVIDVLTVTRCITGTVARIGSERSAKRAPSRCQAPANSSLARSERQSVCSATTLLCGVAFHACALE